MTVSVGKKSQAILLCAPSKEGQVRPTARRWIDALHTLEAETETPRP